MKSNDKAKTLKYVYKVIQKTSRIFSFNRMLQP